MHNTLANELEENASSAIIQAEKEVNYDKNSSGGSSGGF
jgi:hypothetical protein